MQNTSDLKIMPAMGSRQGRFTVVAMMLMVSAASGLLADTLVISDSPSVVRRSEIREAIRQDSTWTSENIQKNPYLFLQDQIANCDALKAKIEAQNITLIRMEKKASRAAEEAESTKARYEKFLADAKAAYKAANGKWPVSVNGYDLDEDELNEKISDAMDRVELAKKEHKDNAAIAKKVSIRKGVLKARKRELVSLRMKLVQQAEQVKMNSALAALKSHIAQSRQALRQKEYAEWKASDDGQASVSLEEFESKHKDGWRDRAKAKKAVRLEQEAKAAAEKRRLAEIERLRRQHAEIIDGIAQDDLKKIREAYAKHEPYRCTYPRSDRNADWLATWTEPRLEMTEADKLAGEALLSEFGTKYLPNAYANYEKVRERAIELQQVFNEEFAQPWTIDNANSKWSAFNKVLEKLAKARAEYFFCHDELCHYWMKQKFGVLPIADFTTIDSQRLAVRLLPEDTGRSGHTLLDAQPMESEMSDFAAKYAPESYAVYKKLEQEDKEWGLLLKEVVKQHEQIDDVRFDRTLANAISKKNDIVREMSLLSIMFQGWRMDHRMTEKTSEDIAKLDHEQALSMKCFIESLPT